MSDTYFYDQSKTSIHEVIKKLVHERIDKDEIDAFSVLDLSYVKRQILRWQKNFPNIEPFYAVKANDNEQVLRTIATIGGSFDCASQSEMERVLALGVAPSRIVYANPVRCRKMLEYSRDKGIEMLSADCASELHKIAAHHPKAKIIVRILPPIVKTNFWLGKKFGLPSDRVAEFVQVARTLKLNLIGVSFHCGTPFQDADAVARAIPVAKRAFEVLASAGYEPYLLDIGGGFPGNEPHMTSIFPTLEAIAKCTQKALEFNFPGGTFNGRSLKIIAEPGQYMVYSSQTLVARVIGKKRFDECVGAKAAEPDMEPGITIPNHSLDISPSSLLEDSANCSIDDCLTSSIEECSNGPIDDNLNGSVDENPNGSLDDGAAETTITREMRTRSIHEAGSSTPRFVYFLNHGRYGHFVFIKGYLDDTLKPMHVPIGMDSEREVHYPSIIYGPTCDSADIIMENVSLPELEVDNWIYFEGMGAYTNVVACEFNGFPIIRTIAIADVSDPELGQSSGLLAPQLA